MEKIIPGHKIVGFGFMVSNMKDKKKSARQIMWEAESEEDLQEKIIGYARFRGWKIAHFRSVKIQRKDKSTHYATPVQADGKGFPDLIIARKKDQRLIFAEIKRELENPNGAQLEWLQTLAGFGREVHVWRPSDWDEIVNILH